MATVQRSSPLEIRHEPQQSHDSGAYIDWNSDSGSPTRKSSGSEVEVSLPVKRVEEFVTVVSVEGDGTSSGALLMNENIKTVEIENGGAKIVGESLNPAQPEVPFVTVLSVGGDAGVSTDNGATKTESPSTSTSGSSLSLEISGNSDTEFSALKTIDGEIETLADSEIVLVYRLPGERLGFGLKFEGGTKTAERVRRLFIQSCAAESPASRARCSWGGLGEGDEVLEIDTVPVSLMTRLDCVRRLKESRVVISLRVRPAPGRVIPSKVEEVSPSEPPPVPPRKGQRRGSAPKAEEAPPPPVGFGDDGFFISQRRRASEGDAAAMALSIRQRMPPSPIGRNRLSPEHPVPPEAETYIDLLAQEEYMARNAESESDDTGSSISTVVDRLSLNSVSAMSSASSENRSPEHGPYGSAIDLARVLDPFERLEREFSSDSEFSPAKSSLTTTIQMEEAIHSIMPTSDGRDVNAEEEVMVIATVQTTTALEDALALQPPPNFQDMPFEEIDLSPSPADRDISRSESEVAQLETPEKDSNEEDAPKLPPKPAPRKEGHRFRSGKKRPPPPPPPPRSDRPVLEEKVEEKENTTVEEVPEDPKGSKDEVLDTPDIGDTDEKTADEVKEEVEEEEEVEEDNLFNCGDGIDLSPERIEEEIEKVAEMWKTEGRKIVLDEDEVIDQVGNILVPERAEEEEEDDVDGFENKDVEELLEKLVERVPVDIHEEAIVVEGLRDPIKGCIKEDKEGREEEEGEDEEEEEEDDEEDDDLMIDSRLGEELWQSGPVDVLFPPFHWSVTQLATIGEDEEEQSETEERSSPERLSAEEEPESLSEEEEEEDGEVQHEAGVQLKESVPEGVMAEREPKAMEAEEEVGEAEETMVAVEGAGAEGIAGGKGETAGEIAPPAPRHLRQSHLGDRVEGNGEEVVEKGSHSMLDASGLEGVPSGEDSMPLEETSVGEGGVEDAGEVVLNAGDEFEAHPSKDPCADITAALGPTPSPISCESQPSSCDTEEEVATPAVQARAERKGSAPSKQGKEVIAESVPSSTADGPACSTPIERCNGGGSIQFEPSPLLAVERCEKVSSPPREDLRVTSNSDDTGLGNMDSLLSVQSPSSISNGFSHSNDDSSLPPSFSRLPPDGHEFPPNYQEPLRTAAITMTSDLSMSKTSENSSVIDSPPDMPPPPLPSSCPPQKDLMDAAPPKPKSLPPPPPVRKPSSHTDMSSFPSRLPPRSNAERRHWMKDEKSEKSVRDKIAMFQSEKSGGDNPPPVPPVPAIRSPVKYEITEELHNKSSPGIRKIPQWEDPRGRHHLSRSMLAVDGTGRMNDHTPTSPHSHSLHTSSLLYKNAVHNSTGDVSSGNEGGAGDGSRALDFARTRSTMDLTSSSASCSPDSSLSSASSYSSTGVAYATLPRKPTAIPRPPPVAAERKGFVSERRPQSPDSSSWRTSTFSPPRSGNLHSRSQSLVDVATPKRHSIGGTYNYRYSNINGIEDSRKSSLNAMIEQRRKNVSKLRGLVIPEKPEVPRCDQSVFDLPEIKSRDAIIISANCNTSTLPRCESKLQKRWSENMNGHSLKAQNAANGNHHNGTTNGVTLTSPPWKSQAPLPDLPKYSPAFKRRSLSVHGLSSTPSESNRDDLRNHNQDQFKIIPPMKPPRASNGHGLVPSSPLGPEPKSLESITSPRSDTSFDFSQICHTDSSKEDEVVPVIKSNGTPGSFVDGHNGKVTHRGLLHVPHSRASAEDSDNDSAVSSSRSSISHGFSPPSSPLPGDTSDGGHRPSAPRQHISRDRIHPEDRHRSKNSSRHSGGSASERANSPDRRPLRRTLSSETTASVSSAASTASTVTSGSHDGGHGGSGSDSSSNRRVLKAQSVEAINRKNVLASAKYSSGRDLKVGSPLIKRKFEEDGSGTEADIEDAAKIEAMPSVENSVPRSNGLTHYQTTREVNGIHDIETTRNMDIKVAYVDEIIEYPFVNGNVELVEPPMPAQRRVADSYPSISSSPRATSPISEYSTTESVCGSHREDKKTEVHAPEDVSAAEELKRSTSTSPSGVRVDRWMELEKKYAPKTDIRNSMEIQESHVYRGHILEDEMDYLSRKAGLDLDKARSRAFIEKQKDSGNVFRAIAEKWQIISNDSSTVPSPTNPVAAAASIPANPPAVNGQFKKHSKVETYEASRTTPSSESLRLKLDESYTILSSMETSTLVSSPQTNCETTKAESVRLRDRKPTPSLRPLSFNDCSDKTLTPSPEKESYTPPESSVKMTPEPKISSTQSPVSTTTPTLGSQRPNNRRSVSVNDIRKAFEKAEPAAATNVRTTTVTRSKTSTTTTTGAGTVVHTRVSSLDSTTSEDSNMPTPAHYGSVNNLASNHRDQFGSITSLASSTSLISPQELQQLIEEANQSLDETSSSGGGAPLVHEVEVVVLHREMAGSSVGITLAGGADYEAKEITVHKVLAGSPAERDGRVQRGDRILSINGKSTKGATHREAISILKAPRSEVVLVVSRSRLESSQTHQPQYQGTNGAAELSMAALSAVAIRSISSSSRPPRIAEQPMEGNGGDVVEEIEEKKVEDESRGPPETVVLTKDGAGLGFSLEGGKDSPSGDKPLTVKKIFTGGAAEKHGGLRVGDELLVVNGIDVTPLSRIEAWGIMKKLPDGMVSLTIRRKI